MNKYVHCLLFFCIGSIGTMVFQIRSDIHAIRAALEPRPFSVGQQPPPMRSRVLLREDTKRQQPEVTLL